MAKHTPGPWVVMSNGGIWTQKPVEGSRGCPAQVQVVATAAIRGNPFNDKYEQEMEANACLIAAAPELLEALKELCNYIDQEGPCSKEWEAISQWCEKGKAAIAKAEGRDA